MPKKAIGLLLSLITVIIIYPQCPDRNILVDRINYLRDVARIPINERIAELNSYLQNINNCPYKNDSTHAYLLRNIGVLYRYKGDFLKAAQYFRQSIQLIVENSEKPSVSMRPLLSGY